MASTLPLAGAESQPAPIAPLFAGLSADSEEALARFDAAHDPFEPDQSLLSGTPARSLAQALIDMVDMLKRIDIDRVARRQSWWHRFTGADLEARVELEVAAHCLGDAMKKAATEAAGARRAQGAMRADLPRLDAAQLSHQAVIDAASALLRGADSADQVVARLQRRLGNLEALHASNRLTRAQMILAIDHLSGLLDRFTDIEQLLFPVWQQHALAVAQGAATGDDASSVMSQLRSVHTRFQVSPLSPRTSDS
jgi:hypothetical protein